MAVDVPQDLWVRGPSGELTPERRPGSVRRTSTIDMSWPDGLVGALHLSGRARDLLTEASGATHVLAVDEMTAVVGANRTIEQIGTVPPRPQVAQLVGQRGGSGSRQRTAEAMKEEAEAGSPLFLMLDDVPGVTLIAGYIYTQEPGRSQRLEIAPVDRPRVRTMEGVCTGFQPGSSALGQSGIPDPSEAQVREVAELGRAGDPLAWHEIDKQGTLAMRRARRIDVWVDGAAIKVDSMFQDTCIRPGSHRVAVHEYRLAAEADLDTMTLASVAADPRVLPYWECPLAVSNVSRLIGTPLRELRRQVLEELRGTAGCTHLNDAMRALAEVPALVGAL